jgi:hypothetical protein
MTKSQWLMVWRVVDGTWGVVREMIPLLRVTAQNAPPAARDEGAV